MGGIASYVVSLARGLSGKGHEVFVASGGGDYVEKLTEEGIVHIPIPIRTKSELSPRVLISAFSLLELVKRESIDIIHAHTRVTQVASSLVSKMSKVPYVTTCHGFFKKRLGRRLFGGWGSRTIAISEAVREHLVNDFRVQKGEIDLIYNGIELAKFKNYSENEKKDIRKGLDLKEGPVIGTISRLSPVKGHKYLIEAMKEVIGKVPDAQLLIVGDGSIKEDLISLSKALGIDKNTSFVESLFDTAPPLSIMDIFVLPSLQEGLGLSTIEALAMEKAVIASDVGGVYTVVKDNLTGLLVPSRNSGALAGAIKTLLNDEGLRLKLGREGRKLVEEKFSIGSMVEKVEQVYKKVGSHGKK